MKITVRYFAAARDVAGLKIEAFELPDESTVATLLQRLATSHSELEPYFPYLRFAIADEFVELNAPLGDGDEVSVIPPVAGGDERVFASIESEKLSIDRCVDFVRDSRAGGICLFIGVVRDHSKGQSVSRLDYEAHPTMAKKELTRVLSEVCEAEQDVRLASIHRVGELDIGELAVVVAASAPHRDVAFRACRQAIDTLKERVPIWKKEHGEASTEWVNFSS